MNRTGRLSEARPVMSGIAAAALLPAILARHLVMRAVVPGWRMAVFAAAIVGRLWVTF